MFTSPKIQAYFSRVGSAKGCSAGGNSVGGKPSGGRTALLGSSSALRDIGLSGGEGTPIEISEGIAMVSSQGSFASSRLREFSRDDPRYVHVPPTIAKRACETPNSVCDQPRKRRRSNPAVKLITPERMGVPNPAAVVDLSGPCLNGPIFTLSSDSADLFEACEQEELDPDVEAWLVAQTEETNSYEPTRRFQESWPAKLPWAECMKGEDGLYDFVRCLICSEFEHKEKILKPKFDTLKKHGGKRKAKKAIPSKGIRARQW
jgi:hypothetical protein